jgi:hypothetical protein
LNWCIHRRIFCSFPPADKTFFHGKIFAAALLDHAPRCLRKPAIWAASFAGFDNKRAPGFTVLAMKPAPVRQACLGVAYSGK